MVEISLAKSFTDILKFHISRMWKNLITRISVRKYSGYKWMSGVYTNISKQLNNFRKAQLSNFSCELNKQGLNYSYILPTSLLLRCV